MTLPPWLRSMLPVVGVILAIVGVLGLVAYGVLSAFGGIFEANEENVKQRQEGKTDRTTVRQTEKTGRTTVRQSEQTERVVVRNETSLDKKALNNCKDVCCEKRFLGFCTRRDPKCYNNCAENVA